MGRGGFRPGWLMRVLVACEYSGRVRSAFRAAGHDAYSCDLLDCEDGQGAFHLKGDVRYQLQPGRWDLMVAHPPCTDLAVSGAAHFWRKDAEQEAALEFVRLLMRAPVERIAVENPVSVIATRVRPADQVIQPWQFGHGETKATCLWLKNLPALMPTDVVPGRESKVHLMSPGPDRWKNRSRTYLGIAAAMASQWGSGRWSQRELSFG